MVTSLEGMQMGRMKSVSKIKHFKMTIEIFGYVIIMVVLIRAYIRPTAGHTPLSMSFFLFMGQSYAQNSTEKWIIIDIYFKAFL